jgi:mRNA-degrading endonuclease RelE of RelBE toxin-antitoxin system
VRFDVRLSRSAERYLERVPGDVQRRVVARLDQVAQDPFGPHTKPLAGPGARRAARVGALGIIFTVDRVRRMVEVSDIGPRGQIYHQGVRMFGLPR